MTKLYAQIGQHVVGRDFLAKPLIAKPGLEVSGDRSLSAALRCPAMRVI